MPKWYFVIKTMNLLSFLALFLARGEGTYWNCDKGNLMSLSLRKVDQLFHSGLPGACCGCGGAVLLTKAMSFSSFVSSAFMALLTLESWFKSQLQTNILSQWLMLTDSVSLSLMSNEDLATCNRATHITKSAIKQTGN